MEQLSSLHLLLVDGEQEAEEGVEQQSMARVQKVVAELESYMQKFADDEDSAPKSPPKDSGTSSDQSARLDKFKYHMGMLKSIDFLPQSFEGTLNAVNTRMPEDAELTPQRAFGIL